MDYEKKYKEALEKAKKIYNENKAQPFDVMLRVFPELTENKDEKIREWLIDTIKQVPNDSIEWETIDKSSVLAWLEKQGEHANFRNKIQIGDKVTRNEDGVLVNMSQLNRVAKKQGEQKPHGQRKECKDCQMNYAGECKGSCQMKRDEQNPAENVELSAFRDKLIELFKRFEWYCKDKPQTNKDIIEYVDAHIQELIDTITIQKPAEWSEEDEEMFKEVLTDIIYAKNDLEAKECLGLSKRAMEAFNWFSKRYKSLSSQSTWKPSEE